MLSTQSLREQLDRYVEGRISASALEEWLAAESWDMGRWAPLGLQRLVENIQAAFIAYSDGDTDSSVLDQELRERHEQLSRSAEASKSIPVDIEIRSESGDSVAASQALPVSAVAVPAVA